MSLTVPVRQKEQNVEYRPPRAVSWGNVLVTAAMVTFWILPILRFWGAVWGPLRPFSYRAGDLAPAWPTAMAAAFICLVPLALPRSYYGRVDGARLLRLYESLGVRFFRALATNGDYINRAARRQMPSYKVLRDEPTVDFFAGGTQRGERDHMVLLLVGVTSAIYAAHIGWNGWAVGLTAGNVAFNLYPVLLQRYNRARFARVRRRLSATRG